MPISSGSVTPAEDDARSVARAHKVTKLPPLRLPMSADRRTPPFFYPAVVPPRWCGTLDTGAERSVALRDATGFPALGSSAVRRPGRSSETAGPPVALPAPARGFRAGSVLSLSSTPAAISQPPPSSRPSAFSAAAAATAAAFRPCVLHSAPRSSTIGSTPAPNFSSSLLRPSCVHTLSLYLSLSLLFFFRVPTRPRDRCSSR